MNHSSKGLLALGLSIAVGLAACGYFIGQTLFNAKIAANTAEAKGLAERRVMADTANWTLMFQVEAGNGADIASLYAEAEQKQSTIIALLTESGFEPEEVQIGVIDYFVEEYRDNQQTVVETKHTLRGSINVETQQVQLVAKVRSKINKLIAQGINIDNREPSYLFTRLNEIKPEMLREATQNAKIAANEFAQIAGVKVGNIQSARQGNFFIRDAGENYGDSRKIDKDVRVVTTITFYLTD